MNPQYLFMGTADTLLETFWFLADSNSYDISKKHAVAVLICVFCLDMTSLFANFAYVILILTGQNDYYEETLPFRHLHDVAAGVMGSGDGRCEN